jgi:hypothetical protein
MAPCRYGGAVTTLRRGWAGTDLGPYRACDGTYCYFEEQSLPALPELSGTFAWLPTSTRDRMAYVEMPRSVTVPSDARLPPSYVSFMGRPERMAAIPSCTACYWSPGAPFDSPLGDGTRLVRFLSDQQDVLHWYLWLTPDGGHRVVCGGLPYGEEEIPSEDAAADLFEAAPSFESFLYRFWVENLAWFEIHHLHLAEEELSPAVRAYLGQL